jgi:hypothetical protein
MTDVLRFVNVFFAALVAGGTFFSVWALRPAIRELPAREGLDLHRRTSRRVEMYMPLSGLITLLAAIGVLVADRHVDSDWIVTAVGVGLTLANIALAFTLDVPVTKKLNALPDANFDEAEYTRLSDLWDRFHLVRGLFGFAALGCFIVGALLE